MKKLVVILVLCALGVGSFFVVNKLRSSGKKDKFTLVAVENGSIVEKALAIGTIGPKHEIVVKSQVSGTVERLYMEVGTVVNRGEPLLSVKPEPTPIELANTRRELELTSLTRENASRELERSRELLGKSLLVTGDFRTETKDFRRSQAA